MTLLVMGDVLPSRRVEVSTGSSHDTNCKGPLAGGLRSSWGCIESVASCRKKQAEFQVLIIIYCFIRFNFRLALCVCVFLNLCVLEPS